MANRQLVIIGKRSYLKRQTLNNEIDEEHDLPWGVKD